MLKFYFLVSSTHLTSSNSQMRTKFSNFCGGYLTCQKKKKTLTKTSNYSESFFFYCTNYFSMLFYVTHVCNTHLSHILFFFLTQFISLSFHRRRTSNFSNNDLDLDFYNKKIIATFAILI